MFGWYLGCFLVVLFIFWRTKKKYFTILSELSSRISLVEELLLEICAVLEEQEPLSKVSLEMTETIVEEESSEPSREPLVFSPPQDLEEKQPNEKLPTNPEQIMPNSSKPVKEVQKPDKLETKKKESIPEKAQKVTSSNSKENKTHAEQKTPEEEGNTNLKQETPKRKSKVNNKQETLKKEIENIEMLATPERHQTIIELYQKGLTVKEIARQSGMGQGEVQLIIDLYVQQD